MANKDKRAWLQLLRKRFNYEPVSKIRRKTDYNRKIEFYEAIEIAGETDAQFLINVVFPFESRPGTGAKSGDNVTIFPQTIYYRKNSLFELAESILYDSRLYSIDDFIAKCPKLNLYNADNMFGIYTFSLSYFLMETDEVNRFKKDFLTPIKKKITETHFWPDKRGSIKNMRDAVQLRKNTAIKIYREIVKRTGKAHSLPIHEIWDRWGDLCQRINLDEKYQGSYATIRRDLKEYLEK